MDELSSQDFLSFGPLPKTKQNQTKKEQNKTKQKTNKQRKHHILPQPNVFWQTNRWEGGLADSQTKADS